MKIVKMTVKLSENVDSTGNNGLCGLLRDHLRYRGMVRSAWP